GTWFELTSTVTTMASNLTTQVRSIAVVTKAVANGDLSKKIEVFFLESLFSTILLRLVLFLAGFFHIKTDTVSIRKSHGSSRVESKQVKSGDVIVSNWTSYIDIIYLASKYNPVFTQIYIDSDKVKLVSLWEAIRLAGRIPESTPLTDQVYSVKELSLKAKECGWGPIVVFAEGATTNGRALLKFTSVFNEYSADEKIDLFHVMAFKYEYGTMSPTYTVGNQFYHFFKLCSQVKNNTNNNIQILCKN
ncbi:hypothetical protein INT48_005239, partial [Thamnidium elegans]